MVAVAYRRGRLREILIVELQRQLKPGFALVQTGRN